MTAEIVAFVTALGHATNIAKAAVEARDESKRREALAELTGALAELQAKHLAVIQNQLALLQQNEGLRKQLATYDQWEKEKARYKLENIGAGALVRAFHPSQPTDDPPHWICANCYEDRHKSPLQSTEQRNDYVCPKCNTTIIAITPYPSA